MRAVRRARWVLVRPLLNIHCGCVAACKQGKMEEDIGADARSPLLAESNTVRQRSGKNRGQNKTEVRRGSDWDPNLPYGGKVYLARRKKPDPWWITILEVIAITAALSLAFYAYYYFDNFHYHVTRGYAHLGYPEAQHVVGQKLLFGRGVDKDEHKAMEWFKKAADQGHPHASYNVALGHIKGIRTDLLKSGESHQLMMHAASKGVDDARRAVQDLCSKGKCP